MQIRPAKILVYSPRPFRRQGHGFTAIEMIATTALAAILMIGLLSITSSISRSQARLDDHKPRRSVRDQLTHLLRWDLTHARAVRVKETSRLQLLSYNDIDRQGGEASHQPVRIEYRLKQNEPRSVLVRRQRPGNASKPWQVDALLPDVKRVRFSRRTGDAQTAAASGQRPLRITIEFHNGPTYERVLLAQ